MCGADMLKQRTYFNLTIEEFAILYKAWWFTFMSITSSHSLI